MQVPQGARGPFHTLCDRNVHYSATMHLPAQHKYGTRTLLQRSSEGSPPCGWACGLGPNSTQP